MQRPSFSFVKIFVLILFFGTPLEHGYIDITDLVEPGTTISILANFSKIQENYTLELIECYNDVPPRTLFLDAPYLNKQ